ncbi:MAG: DUF559 domain-containing protein [Sulfuritalea sp.]|nr:DUF559 domain-containing protein [Sulfuritalea sp.]
MTEGLAPGAPQVLDLLSYIEQVEKLKTKPAFSVPTEFFVAYQHELKGLPELQFNLQVEGDDVWLRLPRLQEIAAPEPDEILRPWVALPKSPEKTPELKGEIIILEGKREVARERIEEHLEVRELFDWYVEYQWEPWAMAERPRRKTIARYNQLFSVQQAISSEGADTPLELVWGIGYRKGDVNDPEAKAMVDEIESILADPVFEGRSIGVVTLHGTAQAALIHKLVSERISPIDVIARKIAIGPPPVFQGRERDIILVSMVQGPGNQSAANRADMHQRFNVALSRARDRMYLFRSVGETEFREDSLNGKVISHFKQPFRQDAKKVRALREKCESGFEFEMFDELVRRGFRVEPQVPCGGYRIDFVVEGNEGRRLAIECDGDRFHGPGQWQDDMMRQRVLERAGWTFWRCFASSFVRRRETVLTDLMQTLQKLGIEPLGAETVDNTVWVHYKEVDPYGVEADEEQEIA